MSTWQTLKLVQDTPRVCTLVLNRPERRNAINRQMALDLLDALTQLRQRRDLRVLVLTGEGSAFCAGGDLKDRFDAGASEASRQRNVLLDALAVLDGFPCPVIAMLNGAALAGGFEVALACDIRVASHDALVGLPEVRTAGGFPGGGGPVRLERLMGRGHASLVVLTGRTFTAAEALSMGMVDTVHSADRLQHETAQLAAQIAANRPLAVSQARELLRRSADLDLPAAIALSREMRDPLDHSPDALEAVSAWRERRPPIFQDR
jgi:enoyl-CoA hydratase